MKTTKSFVLERFGKKSILLDAFWEDNPKATVIFCHGFKGFKDWGPWELVAEKFAQAGFFFVKFNFSHNGGSIENPIDFPDLQAFGENNFSKELDDLEEVLNWTEGREESGYRINGLIFLIGHSRGGGISLIKASEDKRVRAISTWASVADFESRFPSGADLEKWKKSGVLTIKNSRTKQEMPLFYQFFQDFQSNRERLNISRAAGSLQIPLFVVHGDEDNTVGVEDAQMLHEWVPMSRLKLISETNHTFGAIHPYRETILPAALRETVEETINFFSSIS